jgi:hypothetical protein
MNLENWTELNATDHSPPFRGYPPAARVMWCRLAFLIEVLMTRQSRVWLACGLACSLLMTATPTLHAQAPAPDNTKTNARDRQPAQKTADDQSNRKSDVEITRQIRRAIVKDKSLSTYAHNIKIVTAAGKVTLKGPVKSEAEKAAVEAKANEIAGPANVSSQVSVTDTPANAAHPKKVGR